MKRAVSIIILVSMVLHCASRLGVISYLYSKRHDIAYSVGLIAEIPIAMCNSEYFPKQAPLVIKTPETTDESRPIQFFQAHEILLFVEVRSDAFRSEPFQIKTDHNTAFLQSRYTPPALSIFHPPC